MTVNSSTKYFPRRPYNTGRKAKEAPRKRRDPVHAQALFERLLRGLGYNPENYAVFEIWDRLLGREAEKAKAVGLMGRRLCVEVDSSARLHDLTLRKRMLLKKLNGHFGTDSFISDIILQLAGDRRNGTVG